MRVAQLGQGSGAVQGAADDPVGVLGRVAVDERAAAEAHDRVADELVDDDVVPDQLADDPVHRPLQVLREHVGPVGQGLAGRGEADEVGEDHRRRHPRLLQVGGRVLDEVVGHLLRQRQVQQGPELRLRGVLEMDGQDEQHDQGAAEHRHDQEELDVVGLVGHGVRVEVDGPGAAVDDGPEPEVQAVGGGLQGAAQRGDLRGGRPAGQPTAHLVQVSAFLGDPDRHEQRDDDGRGRQDPRAEGPLQGPGQRPELLAAEELLEGRDRPEDAEDSHRPQDPEDAEGPQEVEQGEPVRPEPHPLDRRQAAQQVDQEPGGPQVRPPLATDLGQQVEDEGRVDQRQHDLQPGVGQLHRAAELEQVDDDGHAGQDQHRPLDPLGVAVGRGIGGVRFGHRGVSRMGPTTGGERPPASAWIEGPDACAGRHQDSRSCGIGPGSPRPGGRAQGPGSSSTGPGSGARIAWRGTSASQIS